MTFFSSEAYCWKLLFDRAEADQKLEGLGAQRVYERGEGDDDQNIEEDFEQRGPVKVQRICVHFQWKRLCPKSHCSGGGKMACGQRFEQLWACQAQIMSRTPRSEKSDRTIVGLSRKSRICRKDGGLESAETAEILKKLAFGNSRQLSA